MITDKQVETAARIIWDEENGEGDYDRICGNFPTMASDPRWAFHIVIRGAIEAAEAAAWEPIETAPKDGTRFWAFTPALHKEAAHWGECVFTGGHFQNSCAWHRQPTYWRPLPSPPGDKA